MNYYPHHIADFNNATRHLSRIERSIYRDLLDIYYDSEGPLTLNEGDLARKIVAKTEEEKSGLEQVLNEFFLRTNDGWKHERCEAVLEDYRKKQEQQSRAGKASAAKRSAKVDKPMANKRAREAAKPLKDNDIERPLNAGSTPVQRPFNAGSTDVQPTKTKTKTMVLILTNQREAPQCLHLSKI